MAIKLYHIHVMKSGLGKSMKSYSLLILMICFIALCGQSPQRILCFLLYLCKALCSFICFYWMC